MSARWLAMVPALLVSFMAHAADATYPANAVKVVVPFAAGSSTDLMGREVARSLGEGLHQSFVVENRPGGQSTIGSSEVARAAPDGYTLLIGSTTSISAAPFLIKNLPYDPGKSFTPIARLGAVVFVLVVRPDLPVKSTAELIDYGLQHPGKLNWGYANAANQASAAALQHYGKFDATGVPYTGVPQIIVDLLGGRLDFAIVDTTTAGAQIKSGKLRALAVTTAKPFDGLPGVPPMGDTVKGFELVGWYGLYAPAKTPAPVVDALSRTILAGLKDPGLQQRLAGGGLMVYPANAADLTTFGETETAKWARLVKDADIHPQ